MARTQRELETSQLIRLMNVIAEEIYIGKFDSDVGTDKIESRCRRARPSRTLTCAPSA
jgi:hypothetical protein